jgi:HTH-type transcriptional regulator, competence development regulator
MSALTEFGTECRRLRSVRGHLMLHQADALQVSSAFISAVETGSKAIPAGYVEKVAAWLKLSPAELAQLRDAANGSTTVVRVRAKEGDTAKLVAEFAQSVEKLSNKQIRELRLIINNGSR